MYIAFCLIVLGLILLYFGAEGLVRGSSNLGLRFGISPLIVGLTIVAFGTSAPELAVSVNAARVGQTDVSIANVLGSNIANIGLILGISALIQPIKIDIKLIRIDIPIMIAATIFFCILIFDTNITHFDGALLTVGIIAFTVFSIYQAKNTKGTNSYEENIPTDNNMAKDIGFIIVGLVMLTFGAKYLVDGAIQVAQFIGISEVVIGFTIIAVGTSLPELATSILAASRKMSEIAAGNVIGSNIFNLLSVLGITALFAPLPLGDVTWVDIIVMLAFSLAVLPLARSGFVLNRTEGAILVLCYFGYVGWLVGPAL